VKRALIEALARENLTQEAALRILAAVFPVCPIDTQQFGSSEHAGYVLAIECFAAILPELHPLHVDHYAETERHRHGIALDPDYPALIDLERAGRLLQVTCRHQGTLVGHIRMFLHRSTHTQTLFAEEDTLYLAPAHRGGMTAIRMIEYVEKCLSMLGVREIRANSKLSNRADVLLKRRGYQPVALQFVKLLASPRAQEAALVLTQGETAHGLPP
jgi:hypothetical protein